MAFASRVLVDLTFVAKANAQTCPTPASNLTSMPPSYAADPGLMAMRADVLFRQIQNNYGYFGLPSNWTTLWSYKQLSTWVDKSLNDADSIFSVISSLICNIDTELQQEDTFQKAIDAATTVQKQLSDQISQLDANMVILSPLIDSLGKQIQNQKVIVLTASENFQQTVLEAAGNGCSFADILEIVIAIVAVVAAAYVAGEAIEAAYAAIDSLTVAGVTAVAELAQQGEQLFEELVEDYEKLKPMVTKVEASFNAVMTDIKDVSKKYQDLSALLNANPDSARVLVDQDGFDKLTAAKFNDLLNAIKSADVDQSVKDDLINALHKYMDLVQLRNKKIYEYDSSILSIRDDLRMRYEISIEIAKLTLYKSRIQANLVPKQDLLGSLNRVQTGQLSLMRNAVWNEKRAYAYSQIEPSIISDLSLAQQHLDSDVPEFLLAAHKSILDRMGAANLNGDAANITWFNPPIGVRVSLSDADRSHLVALRYFVFNIGPKDFPIGQTQVEAMVTAYTITCHPISPSLVGSLIHLGHHQFQKSEASGQGNAIPSQAYFASAATVSGFQTGNMTHPTDIRNLRQLNEIPGVSAFGGWAIRIDPNVPVTVLRDLQSLTITFNGHYRSPSA
jgi:predicted  nucleic acid-binding Zn-ribbon protein